MPRRLARKLILSITVIVVIVAGVSGLVNVRTEEDQLLYAMTLGADQLSKAITSSTWHAMLDDRRAVAYQVMQTIASQEGIDRIRMFNRLGEARFSTNPADSGLKLDHTSATCAICHAPDKPLLQLDLARRVRIYKGADGRRRLEMVTPIYNERSCSEAECHAHPAELKVLGILDLALNLDSVDAEVANMKYRALVVTGIQIALIGLCVILFTRRFLAQPIARLIEGCRAVSQMKLDQPLVTEHESEELDELAISFNVMQERLRGALEEINQFTQNLETKVEDRTQQLNAAQHKLVQNDRLASLGRLSASVAHEINNPISGVLNLSMLMQRILKGDGIPPGRLEEFRKYLSQITSETSRVGRIVSDLLAFSRRSAPQRSPADLNKIVGMTLSLVRHKLQLSNVEVRVNLFEHLPEILCDASQMQQVLLNLALNAAEATQGKAEKWIQIETSAQGNSVMLVVSDSGEGIPPENLSKIFDPFFTTKSDGKGVGLGLAVSYGIIQAHGGDIEVRSGAGAGTTFAVTLPIEPSAHPGGEPALELARRGATAPGTGASI